MADAKPNNKFFEDVPVVLDAPYNVSLEHLFDDTRYDIEVFKRNGKDPVIRIRAKIKEA